MAAYSYPYAEFTRDFDAITPPLNAAPREYGHALHALRDHMRATYADQVDRLQRGAALGMICDFMVRNMGEFDTGRVAVRGNGENIISEALLMALHQLICPFCFGEAADMPSPADVRARAEQLVAEGVV